MLKEPNGGSMSAKQLKCRINPTQKAYSVDVDMQELATYRNCRVVLYNNLFEKAKMCEPVLGKVHASRVVKRVDIEILPEDFSHYQAMLKWKDIREKPSDVVDIKKKNGMHQNSNQGLF
jgi:hypothetical protein